VPKLPNDRAGPQARRLSEIVDLMTNMPGMRAELVADIRKQLDDGGYVNEEKLNLAIYRMLKDILR
jgi:hypothetical protein